MLHRTIIQLFLTVISFAMFVVVDHTPAKAEWIVYDDDVPMHAGSGMRYQGVRFTLPGVSVRAPLRQIAFFYSTTALSCPIKVHVTDHSRSTRLANIITIDAANGWNFLDISALGISVPHNFFIILENRKCGFPMLDNQEASERSFKGNHLKSMTTRLSHDLLMRAEIGEAWEIPVQQEWDVSIVEKITIRKAGEADRKIPRDVSERWTLYAENSFTAGNSIFGIWKPKKQKFQISLDFEEVREHLINNLLLDLDHDIFDARVTKVSFKGKVIADGAIEGTMKIFGKIFFFGADSWAKVTVERKFTGIPVVLEGAGSGIEQ